MTSVSLLVAVMLITGGCAPPPPPPPTSANLSIDAQGETLEAGAQGGFHIWLKWRVAGMTPGELELARTARRVSDDQLVLRTRGPVTVGEPGTDGTWGPADPIPMFMCPSPINLSVIDRPIQFRLSLEDHSGTSVAAGEVTLVPHCPDGQRELCERICTG